MSDRIVYIITHSDDNPEKAIIPFVLANGALSMDIDVLIILQSNVVMIAKKGYTKI